MQPTVRSSMASLEPQPCNKSSASPYLINSFSLYSATTGQEDHKKATIIIDKVDDNDDLKENNHNGVKIPAASL